MCFAHYIEVVPQELSILLHLYTFDVIFDKRIVTVIFNSVDLNSADFWKKRIWMKDVSMLAVLHH